MSQYLTDGYYGQSAADAPVNERVAFIRRTYLHLCGAVLLFAGMTALLLQAGAGIAMFKMMSSIGTAAWIGMMVVFIGGSIGAQYMARSDSSPAIQYLGLGLFVGLYTIMFLPILTLCTTIPQFKHIPQQAGLMTLIVFGGLSAVVFVSKRDFSFLGYALPVLALIALGLIITSVVFGFSLGIWFSVGMIALMCGYVLYDTSNVLHHYDTRSHVAASLALFSTLATLFYYIVRLMMQLSSSND